MTPPEPPDFLTEADLLARYRGGPASGTLRNWRSQGRGPPFVRIGRQVLYPRDALLLWEAKQFVANGDACDTSADENSPLASRPRLGR